LENPAAVAAIYDGTGDISVIILKKSFLLYTNILKKRSLIY
jgi:hypothetical protein